MTGWPFLMMFFMVGSAVGSFLNVCIARWPLELSVVAQSPCYQNPWVWGSAGAALVAAAGIVYLVSPAPR